MAVVKARVIKFVFAVEGVFLTTENAQQQEKIVINVIKSNSRFFSLV